MNVPQSRSGTCSGDGAGRNPDQVVSRSAFCAHLVIQHSSRTFKKLVATPTQRFPAGSRAPLATKRIGFDESWRQRIKERGILPSLGWPDAAQQVGNRPIGDVVIVVGAARASRVIGIDAQVSKQEGLATGLLAAAVGLNGDENGVDLRQTFGIIVAQDPALP